MLFIPRGSLEGIGGSVDKNWLCLVHIKVPPKLYRTSFLEFYSGWLRMAKACDVFYVNWMKLVAVVFPRTTSVCSPLPACTFSLYCHKCTPTYILYRHCLSLLGDILLLTQLGSSREHVFLYSKL